MLAQDMIVRENLEATKGISNIDFTVQELPPLIMQELNSKDLSGCISGSYHIEKINSSLATEIFFIFNKDNGRKYCIKIWRPCNDIFYKTMSWNARVRYIIEGINFNRTFAPCVYLGIASFYRDGEKVRLGELIPYPLLSDLEEGVEYGLVMECLDESWQLSYQLHPSRKGTFEGMAFIAKEAAQMHERLPPALENFGNRDTNLLKWDLNRKQFFKSFERLFPKLDMKDYDLVDSVMTKACEYCLDLFEQRYKDGYIKRCHGDLKATNLWICPQKTVDGLERLVALDCVDFRPDFYYIDILSDVAMLAIDIEAYTRSYMYGDEGEVQSLSLSRSFLSSYLKRTLQEENEDTLTLLEYYMTEKAVVCSYISVLYDNTPQLGMLYHEVARTHAALLEDHLLKRNVASNLKRENISVF